MPATPYRHLTRRIEQGVQVLTLTDAEIRGDSLAEALVQDLTAAALTQQTPRIVIDLQRVKYISSAGLRALLILRRQLREKNGQMVLSGMSQEVAEVLQTTRLGSPVQSAVAPFLMVADVAAAVGQLQPREGTPP